MTSLPSFLGTVDYFTQVCNSLIQPFALNRKNIKSQMPNFYLNFFKNSQLSDNINEILRSMRVLSIDFT